MRKQRRSNCDADQCLVFATLTVQSFFFLDQHFQASSYLLWLIRPLCTIWSEPRRPVFSRCGLCLIGYGLDLLPECHTYSTRKSNMSIVINMKINIGSTITESTKHMSLDARKPVFGVSDQVRHKPACTSSEKS